MKTDSLHPRSPEDNTPGAENARQKKHAGLIWIGVLKLLKALLFLSIGIGAVRLLHRDIAEVILQFASKLRFFPENRVISLLNSATGLTDVRLREISVSSFLYAALATVEATGLLLEKAWAEYFTLGLTACFLPLEAYEIYMHPGPWKGWIAVINLVIVLYLIWVIYETRWKKPVQI